MSDINVHIEGLDKFTAALKQFPAIVERRMQDALAMSAAELHKNAEKPLVPQRTRRLISSFGLGIVIGRLVASVGPRTNYAKIVNDGGTRTGKNGKSVTIAPRKYMQKILAKSQDQIARYFKDAADLVVKDIAKK